MRRHASRLAVSVLAMVFSFPGLIVAQAPLPQCVVSGVIYNHTGAVAPKTKVYVRAVKLPNQLIAEVRLPPYESDVNGVVTFSVPRNSTVWVYAPVGRLSDKGQNGVPLTIQNVATADLNTLPSPASVPTNGLTVQDEGVVLSSLIGTINVTGSGASITQASPGVATLNVTGGGGGALTVREVDGAPSIDATLIEFQQSGGFVVTDQTGSVARVDLLGVPVNKLAALTANRAVVSDASGFLSASAVTATEIGHVSGVTSSIQTQINNRLTQAAADALYQPLDADLSALAGLVSAADKLPYFTGSGVAALTDFSAAGRALIDDVNAAAQRATLGLVIGTDVQAQNAGLQQLAGLVDPNADRILFWDDSAGVYAYLTIGTNLTITGTTLDASGGGGGANTALSNLASVSVNAALIPQTALDLGAALTPWRDLYLYGSGTFGSHSLKVTGAPTGNRTATLPDNDGTIAELNLAQTWSATQTFGALVQMRPDPGAGSFSLQASSGNISLGRAGSGIVLALGTNQIGTVGSINAYTTAASAADRQAMQLVSTASVTGLQLKAVSGGQSFFTSSGTLTNTVHPVAILDLYSSNTPAAGYGPALGFQGKSSTTAMRDMGQIAVPWTTATDASRSADIVISLVNNAGALAEVFRVKANGLIVQPQTVTPGGTTGAQTINLPTGTVNIAAGQSTITVTNALVTANSLIFPVIRTNDTTSQIKNVVAGAGSFTITLVNAATAETSVGFWVINQ